MNYDEFRQFYNNLCEKLDKDTDRLMKKLQPLNDALDRAREELASCQRGPITEAEVRYVKSIVDAPVELFVKLV